VQLQQEFVKLSTGDAVKNFYQNQENILAEIKETLKTHKMF
jgi:alanyl-tRNA synthetase